MKRVNLQFFRDNPRDVRVIERMEEKKEQGMGYKEYLLQSIEREEILSAITDLKNIFENETKELRREIIELKQIILLKLKS